MHKGDLSAKIDLSELYEMDHIYALGALENLKGEVQIFASQACNSYVDGSKLKMDTTFHQKACLLVYASVEEWETIAIPPEVENRKDLEDYIVEKAASKGISSNTPIPFLIDGIAKKIDWHVIDWPEGDTEHSHEKHIRSGLHGQLENVDAQFLGFYSDKHKGIFTHHTSNTHIHMKLSNDSIAGHVDDILLGDNMILSLPKLN